MANSSKRPVKSTFLQRMRDARQRRFMSAHKRVQARLKAKTKTVQAKTALRAAKVRQAAETSGGFKGSYARHKLNAIEKSKAKIKQIQDKPVLDKKERLTEMNTKAEVKKANAKYKGYAAVASALGGSYITANERNNQVKLKQIESDQEYLKALKDSSDTVPDVTTDPYSDRSVSGLVTGIR